MSDQSALEGAECFGLGVAPGGSPFEVGGGVGVASLLGDGDAVDGGVELPVASACQPVAFGVHGCPTTLATVPLWRANASLDLKRRTSATAATILAAPRLTPTSASSVGPVCSPGP
jgi:hypothetical protein